MSSDDLEGPEAKLGHWRLILLLEMLCCPLVETMDLEIAIESRISVPERPTASRASDCGILEHLHRAEYQPDEMVGRAGRCLAVTPSKHSESSKTPPACRRVGEIPYISVFYWMHKV